MNVVKYCGLALITVAAAMILSELKPKMSKAVVITVGAAFLCAAISGLYPSVKYITELVSDTPFANYAGTLIKALGVALSVEICADICRDAGENSLASKLETVGKAELLALAIPLIGELLTRAKALLI